MGLGLSHPLKRPNCLLSLTIWRFQLKRCRMWACCLQIRNRRWLIRRETHRSQLGRKWRRVISLICYLGWKKGILIYLSSLFSSFKHFQTSFRNDNLILNSLKRKFFKKFKRFLKIKLNLTFLHSWKKEGKEGSTTSLSSIHRISKLLSLGNPSTLGTAQ